MFLRYFKVISSGCISFPKSTLGLDFDVTKLLLSADNAITMSLTASALTYLSCLDSFIAFESKWAPDLANCSPALGNFRQHKTQGLKLCNKTDNCKSHVGLRKQSAEDLGISYCYFSSKSYLYMKYEQEVIHSESMLNMACYRMSFCKHSLIALL